MVLGHDALSAGHYTTPPGAFQWLSAISNTPQTTESETFDVLKGAVAYCGCFGIACMECWMEDWIELARKQRSERQSQRQVGFIVRLWLLMNLVGVAVLMAYLP